MCGIAGSINLKYCHHDVVRWLGHRGPDSNDYYQNDQIMMSHLRLSIIDVKGGAQPMYFEDRGIMVFNGEIYNYKSLANKYNFHGNSNSDTEVLMYLIDRFGQKALHEVDGMFAFSYYDKKKNKIYLARDRAGKKPLYYYASDKKIFWCSELKCLYKIVSPKINYSHLVNYLYQGYFSNIDTPFVDVVTVPAGSWIEIDLDTSVIKSSKWWNFSTFYTSEKITTLDESINLLEGALDSCIKRRMLASDLEVGAFLSGGIDSGLVTAFASKYTDKLKTFTVSFSDGIDEAPLARLVADKFNTNHHELKIDMSSLKDDIFTIFSNYGQPFCDTSAIPSFYVAKAAKEFITVVLNGDGADELFGGYRRYVPFRHANIFNPNPLLKLAGNVFSKILPTPKKKNSKYNYLLRLSKMFSSGSLYDTYQRSTTDLMVDLDKYFIFPKSKELINALRLDFNHDIYQNLTAIQNLMLLDFEKILFGDLLIKMDIATMAHAIEGRSPFLGKEVLELAPKIQDKYKIKGTTTKFILRQVAKKHLPPVISLQPKRGFEIPAIKWINNDLKTVVNDIIGNHNALIYDFVDKSFIKDVLYDKTNLPADKRAKILWSWLCLEIWYNSL